MGASLRKFIFAVLGTLFLSGCAAGFQGGFGSTLPGTSADPSRLGHLPTPLGPEERPSTSPSRPGSSSGGSQLPPAADVPDDLCAKLDLNSSRFDYDLGSLQDTPSSSATSLGLGTKVTTTEQTQFICRILPIALRLNAEVYRQRLALQYLRGKAKLSSAEATWVKDLARAYGLRSSTDTTELLSRVDVIPLTLLLVQAALESNWGTSTAAQHDNNFFGMHGKMGDANCRVISGNVCLRRFRTPEEGVGAYIAYMNTQIGGSTRFLVKFRAARASQRSAGQALDSMTLAKTLSGYSELGAGAYVALLESTLKKSPQIAAYRFNEGLELSGFGDGSHGFEAPHLP